MQQQSLLPFVLQCEASESTRSTSVSKNSVPSADVQTKRKASPSKHIDGCVMGAMYSVPRKNLKVDEMHMHQRMLTMVPQDSGFGTSAPPSYEAFVLTDDWLHVPRFYGLEQWGKADRDITTLGEAMNNQVEFYGTLNEIQREATTMCVEHLKVKNGGIKVLPCGYGKTVCALYIARQLKRRTLVLVHKSFLIEQWHARTKQFLPSATIGKIQQSTVDADADIVVCMIQSLVKREYPKDVLRSFGLVVIDEAHHMSAPVFSRALRSLPARWVLGLSATPERKDGMTNLLFYSMGPICHRVEREREHTLVSCIIYEGGRRKEILYKNGQVSLPLMLNALATDPTRNALIGKRISALWRAGRHIIVLTDRTVQLKDIHSLLCEDRIPEDDIGFYIASTPRAAREKAEYKRVLLSTYSMAKEGLDIPRLDTLIMASPKSDIVQAIGRIQRKHAHKHVPLVIDIVDTFSVFEQLRWKRWKYYRSQDFRCQTFGADQEESAWFS